MKLVKILALVVGTVALFPSVSFADNVSDNSQEVNQKSVIVGNNNVVYQQSHQEIIDLQKSGRRRANVSGKSQKVNSETIIFGNDNVDIKTAEQLSISGQSSK